MSTTPESAPAADKAVLFDAVLVPHRSLSPRGFQALISVVLVANLLIGIPIFLLGAWPVIGFMGLDVLLLVWLFKLNYRGARLRETLRLTERELLVGRITPEGKARHWSLDTYWLKVEMDDPPQHESRLTLISRNIRLIVGRFLVPEERLEVARALRHALDGVRNRRYAHPWDTRQG